MAFFPNATHVSRAKPIHLEAAQHVVADIQVANGRATRTIRVQVGGSGGTDETPLLVTAKSEGTDSPFPKKIGNAVYELEIFVDSTYVVSATQFCPRVWVNGSALPSVSLHSHSVKVEGADHHMAAVTVQLNGICESSTE
jgi:hypothetical protein